MGKKHRRSGYPLNRLKAPLDNKPILSKNSENISNLSSLVFVSDSQSKSRLNSGKRALIDSKGIPVTTLEILGQELVQQMSGQQLEMLDVEIRRILSNFEKTKSIKMIPQK